MKKNIMRTDCGKLLCLIKTFKDCKVNINQDITKIVKWIQIKGVPTNSYIVINLSRSISPQNLHQNYAYLLSEQ